MSIARLVLRGFCSYKSESLALVETYQPALRDGLVECSQMRVSMFLDRDRLSGIRHGSWARRIIEEISHSLLFFWFNSTGWLGSPTCRWEFDAFRDHVARIERERGLDAGQLFPLMLHPVALMQDDRTFALAGEDSALYASLWRELHRDVILKVPSAEGLDNLERAIRQRTPQACASIVAALVEALGSSGLNDLLRYLEQDRSDFVDYWTAEAVRRQISTDEAAGTSPRVSTDDPADRCRRIARLAGLPLDLYTTDAGPIIATRGPLLHNVSGVKAAAVFGTAFGLWSCDDAQALEAMHTGAGLALPGRAQAEILARTLRESPALLRRDGFATQPLNFWCRDGRRIVPLSRSDGALLATYLVETKP